ncbi:cation transporting ATPase C-terminal domain-containing protein [Actinomadura sediminis]|uniref:Cation transporting ATPase C-terminal domain-containing protein n=1 Tax=Actinomadura sediminis TaxID=1038904 RepID=A0ABW3EJS5_9ACTN
MPLPRPPLLWRGIRRNPWTAASPLGLIALQLLYTYTPSMNDLFHSAPLGAAAWARIAVISYTAVELLKLAQRGTDASAGERYDGPGVFEPLGALLEVEVAVGAGPDASHLVRTPR